LLGACSTEATGKIINICSVQSARARGSTVAYAAAKAALGSLGRALCYDWAPYGIQVNGLAPGYILTDLNAHLETDEESRSGGWGSSQPAGSVPRRISEARWCGLRPAPRTT
jgi:gluconate 5-dehydrogenase